MLRKRLFCRVVFLRLLHRGEAKALWRWSNFLQSVDPPERERVLINMDETSVRLVPDEGPGHVSKRAYRLFLGGATMGRRASLAQRRSTVTHVAAITDNPNFQRILPQVVLVGVNQLSEAKLAALHANKPEYAHIWSYNTGWMTADIMVRYVRLLGRCLKDFRKAYRFLLYFDALRAHLNARVLRAAAAAGLWVCVIPGKLTWALQPCDTHLFASYKRMLSEEVQRRSGLTPSGELSWELVLGAVWHVVAVVMHGRNWSRAFSSVGIANGQRHLSARTVKKLQMEGSPIDVGRHLPTLSDLTHIFPKGAVVPVHELFLAVGSFCRGVRIPEVSVAAVESGADEAPAPRVNPWFGRTRSSSALASAPRAPFPAQPRRACPSATMPAPPPLPPPKSPPPRAPATAPTEKVSLPPPTPWPLPVGKRLPVPKGLPSRTSGDALDPVATAVLPSAH